MKIAIDCRPIVRPWGGVRRYTQSLVEGLARNDRENEYALCGLPRGWDEPSFGPNLRAYPDRFPMARFIDQLRLTSVPGGVDLYHGTNYMAPLTTNFPTVITVHDLSVNLLPDTHPVRRRLRHRLLPILCQRAARIIADSINTKRDLVRCHQIPADKIDVVYLAAGSNLSRVRDTKALTAVQERYGLPERFLLYVGSVEPRKNLPSVLEAVASLKESGRPESLVIAGRGEPKYLAHIRAVLHQHGLEEGRDVHLTGPVAEADLAALYSLCTLFVYPSLYEGFGLPPLEAMACGAPVLLADNSSLSELFETSSAFVELDRPDGLLRAIEKLLDSQNLCDEFVEKGLKRAQSRTWDDIAIETLDVYGRALEGR
ncbi:MAG: glycosyltransferase family 1 protein [Myxococcota bacterium]